MNNFANNFRLAYPTGRPGENPLGEQVSPGFQLRPDVPHGKMPENYGAQQNAIGLTALSLLLGAMGFGTDAIVTALGATIPMKKSLETREKSFSPKEIIIDSTPKPEEPSPAKFIEELKPIDLNGSRDDILRTLDDNLKLFEASKNEVQKLNQRAQELNNIKRRL